MVRVYLGAILSCLGLLPWTSDVTPQQDSLLSKSPPNLTKMYGGAPVKANLQCASLFCNCATACTFNQQTNTCQVCVAPVNGGTTDYVCCKPGQAGQWCGTTTNTANCGALTSVVANPPPMWCSNANNLPIC